MSHAIGSRQFLHAGETWRSESELEQKAGRFLHTIKTSKLNRGVKEALEEGFHELAWPTSAGPYETGDREDVSRGIAGMDTLEGPIGWSAGRIGNRSSFFRDYVVNLSSQTVYAARRTYQDAESRSMEPLFRAVYCVYLRRLIH